MLTPLTAITPIDGRYSNQTGKLYNYFSEYALIKHRVLVEIEYFIALSESELEEFKHFDGSLNEKLRDIYRHFTLEDAQWIKHREKETNHDVKAVEYFVKEKFEQVGLHDSMEFVHFALTSQDINNTAIPCMWKNALNEIYYPSIEKIIKKIETLASQWQDIPMLARTHGQPATPTRLGKELAVFSERLSAQLEQLKAVPHSAKFGGATGNFNAHHVAYPDFNWVDFANSFVNDKLGLNRSQTTTQVEHYDNFAASCDALKRINTILIDFSRDLWTYISMDYFKQKIKEGQIGSSAMPHKVNPIDFENAEGNLGMASALLVHFGEKLPISRLQRDLSDSTVWRNIGIPFSHIVIAFNSIIKGLNKLLLNEEALKRDLENNWAVVAEAFQTILRRESFPKPYEALKELTRTNTKVTEETIRTFIDELEIEEPIKEELRKITPWNYTGIEF
ncbi:MAG TPA: adenylosuccinate lyase [Candidatus Sphingobacterium stercoripullorum]|uniref:Adenylosuccinate lyase n=1 Tax=Candidatus Sphingobacterium stercoripullorum TaxID=2838759 RepID=A0A9D1W9R9_9SPHI|nr:adenylosuccinate lyase [Candidatus Sphingobacterium stercoripullorum]HLR50469.1 adenylosuccinate lyase [Candidatus Sphingobacterium stercoripullorum]